jgi:hypothetical protein
MPKVPLHTIDSLGPGAEVVTLASQLLIGDLSATLDGASATKIAGKLPIAARFDNEVLVFESGSNPYVISRGATPAAHATSAPGYLVVSAEQNVRQRLHHHPADAACALSTDVLLSTTTQIVFTATLDKVPGYYHIEKDANGKLQEIVEVTSHVSGTTYVVTRGQQGTAAPLADSEIVPPPGTSFPSHKAGAVVNPINIGVGSRLVNPHFYNGFEVRDNNVPIQMRNSHGEMLTTILLDSDNNFTLGPNLDPRIQNLFVMPVNMAYEHWEEDFSEYGVNLNDVATTAAIKSFIREGTAGSAWAIPNTGVVEGTYVRLTTPAGAGSNCKMRGNSNHRYLAGAGFRMWCLAVPARAAATWTFRFGYESIANNTNAIYLEGTLGQPSWLGVANTLGVPALATGGTAVIPTTGARRMMCVDLSGRKYDGTYVADGSGNVIPAANFYIGTDSGGDGRMAWLGRVALTPGLIAVADFRPFYQIFNDAAGVQTADIDQHYSLAPR